MASMLALLCTTPFSTEKQRLQMALCTLGNKWMPPNARLSANSCCFMQSSSLLLIFNSCADERPMFGERKIGSFKKPLWNDLWFTTRKQQTGRSCGGRRRACFAPPTTPTNSSPTIPILTATMSDPAPSTGTDSKSVNVVVKGKVQGVFFRKWTVEAAQKLGLNGWVRNMSDGSVEAVMSGPSAAVDNMIQQCHTGPSSAQVSAVEVSKWDNAVPQGFEKRKST